MMKKIFLITLIFFFILIFFTQINLIDHPVTDNDEGIYLTSMLMMNQGYLPYKQIFISQPPGFIIPVYPGFRLFGGNLQAARFTIGGWSLIGLLTVISLSLLL